MTIETAWIRQPGPNQHHFCSAAILTPDLLASRNSTEPAISITAVSRTHNVLHVSDTATTLVLRSHIGYVRGEQDSFALSSALPARIRCSERYTSYINIHRRRCRITYSFAADSASCRAHSSCRAGLRWCAVVPVRARASARRSASGRRNGPVICRTRGAASARGIPAAVTNSGRDESPRRTLPRGLHCETGS